MVERTEEIDAFDGAALRMVVVPGNDVVLVGVRLFGDAIIDNEHAVGLFDGADMRLDEEPEVGAGEVAAGKQALDAVVTDRPAEQGRQAGAGRGPERANQVVRVEIQKFVVGHARSLPYSRSA